MAPAQLFTFSSIPSPNRPRYQAVLEKSASLVRDCTSGFGFFVISSMKLAVTVVYSSYTRTVRLTEQQHSHNLHVFPGTTAPQSGQVVSSIKF